MRYAVLLSVMGIGLLAGCGDAPTPPAEPAKGASTDAASTPAPDPAPAADSPAATTSGASFRALANGRELRDHIVACMINSYNQPNVKQFQLVYADTEGDFDLGFEFSDQPGPRTIVMVKADWDSGLYYRHVESAAELTQVRPQGDGFLISGTFHFEIANDTPDPADASRMMTLRLEDAQFNDIDCQPMAP